ncbi:non-heme iron oxygenase ferredoxin subunit [Streptomyces krungchingensis]
MSDTDYRYICSIDGLEAGVAQRFEVDGTPISLVHTDGQVFAIHDVCSHRDISLSEGEVDGCTIECWLHASRFDLRTGNPLNRPARTPIPVYPVLIKEGDIYVSVSSANAA